MHLGLLFINAFFLLHDVVADGAAFSPLRWVINGSQYASDICLVQ